MQLKSIQVKITLWVGLCLVVMGGVLIGYAAFLSGGATPLLWRQGGLFLVLASATLGVLWYVSGLLARPIKAAARFAENLAQGISTERVTATSNDEIGALINAMNSMLDSSSSLVQSEETRSELQESIIQLLEQVSSVAQGDLSCEITVGGNFTGTLADSFNYMIGELRRVIGQIQTISEQVAQTSNSTQNTATVLVQEAEVQADKIGQITQAVTNMAESIQRIGENAVRSATVAQQSLSNAKQGTEAVQDTIEGMQRIRGQVQETSKKLKRLGESSQEIGEIVQIIGGISKRTSYLALNAAIQAAEAGAAGHGFSVVAEEIERLAKRSAQATKSINSLVKTIQSGTNEAISAMEESTREVVDGSHLANQAGKALTEIESVSGRLADLIAAISQASAEQSQSSVAVTSAMAQVSAITQRTSASIKQSNAFIQDLATVADELRSSVAAFKIPQR